MINKKINEENTSLRTVQKANVFLHKNMFKGFKKSWQLYALLTPAIVYFLVFKYYPMYGLQIAFKDFIAVNGIWGSEWVGIDHFLRFFNAYYFWDLIKNTLGINLYQLALFPVSIIVALA